MPTFYNFRENGLDYSFDDIFVPADLFRDGNLFIWGFGSNGRLGDNTTGTKSTPVTTFAGGTNWKQVSVGYKHTAAIKTDGTLWTWGYGNRGQLGTNDTTQRLTPVTTFAGGTNWKQVSSGEQQTAAIKTDGTLWTWGYANFGQLGDNTVTDKSTPVTTFAGGTNWKQVSSGTLHTAAIKTDGTLWTWGGIMGKGGNSGVLGNGSINGSSTPVTTFAGGTNWKQVTSATRSNNIAAIKTDGTLWTWGYGAQGRLGNAKSGDDSISTPVTTFAGGTNWKQVSDGNPLAAIKTDGTLWIWGTAANGRLGNGATTGNISTPVTTFAGGTNWKQVSSMALDSTVAIKTDGTLWTWGRNDRSQLGNAGITDRSTPVTTFAGGTNWKQVNTGGTHIAAITYIDSVL